MQMDIDLTPEEKEARQSRLQEILENALLIKDETGWRTAIKMGALPGFDGWMPLYRACCFGCVSFVEEALKNNSAREIIRTHYAFIRDACVHGQDEVVRLLFPLYDDFEQFKDDVFYSWITDGVMKGFPPVPKM